MVAQVQVPVDGDPELDAEMRSGAEGSQGLAGALRIQLSRSTIDDSQKKTRLAATLGHWKRRPRRYIKGAGKWIYIRSGLPLCTSLETMKDRFMVIPSWHREGNSATPS